MEYAIVPATAVHGAIVAANIRQSDREELERLGLKPLQEIMASLAASSMAWTGIVNGTPICVFGVSEWADGTGRPWMIGTEELVRHQRIFLRECKSCVDAMKSRHDTLMNLVCVQNVNAIKWLRWLGFKMLDTMPYGVNGELFQRFQWQRSDLAQ